MELSNVIDIHVHVASGKAPCVAKAAPLFGEADNAPGWDGVVMAMAAVEAAGGSVADCLLAKLRRARTVKRAVFLAMDGRYIPHEDGGAYDEAGTYYSVSNEYVRRLAWENPRHVLFGASINPNRGLEEARKELNRCLGLRDGNEAGPYDGGPPPALIKWLPNSQGIDPSGGRKQVHNTFYRLLADRKIPLLVHTGHEHFIPVPKGQQTLGNPQLLTNALRCGVTVIAAHCAAWIHDNEDPEWVAQLGEMMETARANEHKGWGQLYGDLAAFTGLSRPPCAVKEVFRRIPHDRLILGSDAPVPVVHLPLLQNLFDVNLQTLEDLMKFWIGHVPDGFPTRAAQVLNPDALAWARKHAD